MDDLARDARRAASEAPSGAAPLSPDEEATLREAITMFVEPNSLLVARLLATLDAERLRWAERLDAARADVERWQRIETAARAFLDVMAEEWEPSASSTIPREWIARRETALAALRDALVEG